MSFETSRMTHEGDGGWIDPHPRPSPLGREREKRKGTFEGWILACAVMATEERERAVRRFEKNGEIRRLPQSARGGLRNDRDGEMIRTKKTEDTGFSGQARG
jgi:hypothetical protein